jgi:hypothetical protein
VFDLDMVATESEVVRTTSPRKRAAPPKAKKPRIELRVVAKTNKAPRAKSKAAKVKVPPPKPPKAAELLHKPSRRKNHIEISIT